VKNFVLIGAGGYIAPRHLKAIRETGNNLLAALDKHDSVGILDSYFPHADFFTEFERFDRHVEKLRRGGQPIDYVTVCSPNYLHDAHARFGLRVGADVICEKPVVLNPWNVDALMEIEKETRHNVYTLLQLRLHPTMQELKNNILDNAGNKKHEVDLRYITARGNWYRSSWKGDVHKSGGIVTNIGIHFFDLLLWLFGELVYSQTEYVKEQSASGILELEKANIRWFLSTDEHDLSRQAKTANKKSERILVLNGQNIPFGDGFEDLHTAAYQQILAGAGIGLVEAKKSIQLTQQIRNAVKG